MTIINNIEIDNIVYAVNPVKSALINNDPIEDRLHVIIVVSNPSNFATRYILAREFIKRIEQEESKVDLYIVELAYQGQQYHVTDKCNAKHLQLKGVYPLWHKENMINIAVRRLLPPTWKAMAWIDADIEFENPTWATDTLKLLNGQYDVVQLFSHACDMDQEGFSMNVFNSLGYCAVKHGVKGIRHTGPNYPHPGFAWAMTRKAYDKVGGLYEVAILGSGDHIMAKCILNDGLKSIVPESHPDYIASVLEFQEKAKTLRLGYVPGVIRHHFHGSKKNRKYTERWQILVKWDYSPKNHITVNDDGLLIPTKGCPEGLLNDILSYGRERNEDEGRGTCAPP
jgi:hypothetical protein